MARPDVQLFAPLNSRIGFETISGGIIGQLRFRVLAFELLAPIPRQHRIASPSLARTKITLLTTQRYDKLLAVKR